MSAPTTNQPGAQTALWMSTFAFTACFAVWTIFSIIGVQIRQELGLSGAEFGLLIGTPILTGSLISSLVGLTVLALAPRPQGAGAPHAIP